MKNKLIAGIIGMILIVAAVAGFALLLDKTNSMFPEETTTVDSTIEPDTTTPTTSAPTTSGPIVDNTSSIVYDLEKTIGYSVVNDYTYFFFFYDNDASDTVFWKAPNINEKSDHHIKPYADYDLYIASSYDGLDWELDEYDFHDFHVRSGDRLFVSYTRIYNCKNPDFILEDLKQNVFSNDYYFDWYVDYAAG